MIAANKKIHKITRLLTFDNILSGFSWFGFFLLLWGFISLQARVIFSIDYLPIILSFLIAAFLFFKSSSNNFIYEKKPRFIFAICVGIAAIILSYLPAIFASLLMSESEYPKYFFSVDSPYHFSQLIALYTHQEYPPRSLNNLGVLFNYHYGTQLVAAEIAKLGFSMNKAYFGVMFFGFLISMASCIAIIVARASWRKIALTACLSLSSSYILLADSFSFESIKQIESFGGGYPHLSVLSTTYATIFLLYIYFSKSSTLGGRIVIALLPALTFVFKSPHFFIFLFFYFGVIFSNIISDRFEKIDVIVFLIFLISFLSVFVHVTNGNSHLQYAGFMQKSQIKQFLLILSFYILPIIPLFLMIKKEDFFEILPFLSSLFGVLVLYNSFDLYIKGALDLNLKQILYPLPFIYVGLLIAVIDKSKSDFRYLTFVLMPTFLFSILFASNRLYNFKLVLDDMTQWHEFVDNTQLAECLKQVPVQGSIIVTNDLTYPANNYSRTMMQMQIPGIFGHQMYAGNARWEKNYVNMELFKHQDVLSSGSWNDVVLSATNYGWTHAVIFKRTSFSTGPWDILCQNEKFFIAQFELNR